MLFMVYRIIYIDALLWHYFLNGLYVALLTRLGSHNCIASTSLAPSNSSAGTHGKFISVEVLM